MRLRSAKFDMICLMLNAICVFESQKKAICLAQKMKKTPTPKKEQSTKNHGGMTNGRLICE